MQTYLPALDLRKFFSLTFRSRFWHQVIGETNAYARLHNVAVGKTFSLDEVMTFLGISLFLSLVDKAEYANYWGHKWRKRNTGLNIQRAL